MAKTKIKNAEGIKSKSALKTVYAYFNETGVAIHTTKEIFHKTNKTVTYPFSFQRGTLTINPKRIKQISFEGFSKLDVLNKDFKLEIPYGYKSQRMTQLMRILNLKNKKADQMIIKQGGKTNLSGKVLTFSYSDLTDILKSIAKEKTSYDIERKTVITNKLSKLEPSIKAVKRKLNSGQLEEFIDKFDIIEKLTSSDIDAISQIFEKLPSSTISSTTHFIETKEKIDRVYMEDVIEKFKKLMTASNDNEEDWQQFFTSYAWILTHLFPYQVIFKKDKAYVGGKTVDNSEGRIVDFLFQNDLKDNSALLEIKTHKKALLKTKAYREPSVFSISEELSGGINQCLDQKDIFIKEMSKDEPSYDPKCILVIGNKSLLTEKQKKCFELYRANQKNVDLVTFDELLNKLEGLFSVITGKVKTTTTKKKK